MAQELEEDQPPAGEALNIDDTSLGIVWSLVGLLLSCRDLIRLQLLSKEWRKWFTEIAPSLWKAQKRDNVPDWYFPTWLIRHEKPLLSPRHWYGINHPSGACHRLPGLEFLDLGSNGKVEVLTGAGGLLLLYAECERDRMIRVVCPKISEIKVKKRCAEHRMPIKRLIVCNPLTKRWRALSEFDQSIPVELKHLCPALLHFVNRPDFERIKYLSKGATGLIAIHIVVNNESTNYNIVIIWVTRCKSTKYLVGVYDSGMDLWEAITSPKHNESTLGSVCLNRRIYLLEQVGELHVVARVFLVDSRTWLPTDYTLLEKDMYIVLYCGELRRNRTGPGPALVACSGDIYAIVPVREDFNGPHGSDCYPGWCIRHRKICYLDQNFEGAVRFELFKLQEEQKQFVFCQVLPCRVRMNFRAPHVSWNDINNRPCTWYTCASKGSMIWLACGKLLVEFDVVTGSCKRRTVHFDAFKGFESLGENFMPFEPSFCAEP